MSAENERTQVVKISPNDSVVWQWNSNSEISLVEITPQGKSMKRGFKSGPPRRGPALFTHQFLKTGVHYFIDKSSPTKFGIIVVGQPKCRIHKIPTGQFLGGKMTQRKGGAQSVVQTVPGDVVMWVADSCSDFEIYPLDQFGSVQKAKLRSAMECIPR